jgi:predicted nuclease of predicted toxin-antitoxin system
MRFLVDMALSPGLADWLVQRGHDAVHASAIGLARAADPDIIRRARDADRVIITADLDYPRLLALARSDRPGLILFRGGNYSDREVIERLAHALELMPEDDLHTSLVTIERWRIRKRRLPIKLS